MRVYDLLINDIYVKILMYLWLICGRIKYEFAKIFQRVLLKSWLKCDQNFRSFNLFIYGFM